MWPPEPFFHMLTASHFNPLQLSAFLTEDFLWFFRSQRTRQPGSIRIEYRHGQPSSNEEWESGGKIRMLPHPFVTPSQVGPEQASEAVQWGGALLPTFTGPSLTSLRALAHFPPSLP